MSGVTDELESKFKKKSFFSQAKFSMWTVVAADIICTGLFQALSPLQTR